MLSYLNGDWVQGEWKEDVLHGKGVKYFRKEKEIYEGDFLEDSMEGKGAMNYSNGEFSNLFIARYINNKDFFNSHSKKGTVFWDTLLMMKAWVKANICTLMVIITKAIGLRDKHTGKVVNI